MIKSLIAVALWLKDIEAFNGLKFRPLDSWISKFQRKGVRSTDADNVKVELWIYDSLFMRTYNQGTFYFFFSIL